MERKLRERSAVGMGVDIDIDGVGNGSGDGIDSESVLMEQLVDDVVKEYEVMAFRTEPVGIAKAITCSTNLVAQWVEAVSPLQADSAALFLWIDETASMQMIHGLSRQFVARQSRKFLAAVLNLELQDRRSGLSLFGVVRCDDDGAANKYRYKLTALMTAPQILAKFGIHSHDLPRPSRAEPALLDEMALKRPIAPRDVETVQWAVLKVVGRRESHHGHGAVGAARTVPVAHSVMARYGAMTAERIEHGFGVEMVPILVIDRKGGEVAVEWVLCVELIHRGLHCAVSFRYHGKTDSFRPTALYSERAVIESRHRLIGFAVDRAHALPLRLPPLCALRLVHDPDDGAQNAMDIDLELDRHRHLDRDLAASPSAGAERLRSTLALQRRHIVALQQQIAVLRGAAPQLDDANAPPLPFHDAESAHFEPMQQPMASAMAMTPAAAVQHQQPMMAMMPMMAPPMTPNAMTPQFAPYFPPNAHPNAAGFVGFGGAVGQPLPEHFAFGATGYAQDHFAPFMPQ